MRHGARILAVAAMLGLTAATVADAAGPKVIGTVSFVGRPGLAAIPIVAFEWSARNTLVAGGGGAATRMLVFDDFRFTKPLDATSPPLFDLTVGATQTAEVRLDATIRRGTTVSYLLSDAVIVLNARRTPAGGGPPLQDVALTARAIRETVTTPGGAVTSCYDVVAVAPCE